MALHRKEFRSFEAAQNLRRDFSSLIDCATDGWVPPEYLEVAKAGNVAMFEGVLHALLTNKEADDDEPIKDEKDLRAIWSLDLPGQ